ncbi:MAG: hypothetical protein GIX00_09135 [Candidatus Eremiobacteraeota bacterium]|nr:hypothetical protein [Candidatus Eremiobacteraeota bacterium]MBC5808750.1 hypothetical protein [Candidatus Eremiobacteraeota bacterium]
MDTTQALRRWEEIFEGLVNAGVRVHRDSERIAADIPWSATVTGNRAGILYVEKMNPAGHDYRIFWQPVKSAHAMDITNLSVKALVRKIHST